MSTLKPWHVHSLNQFEWSHSYGGVHIQLIKPRQYILHTITNVYENDVKSILIRYKYILHANGYVKLIIIRHHTVFNKYFSLFKHTKETLDIERYYT